jgi:carboxypeptidase PM20D1
MTEMRIEDRLSALIQCRTVSEPSLREEAEFERFRATFAALYPRLHSELELTEFESGHLLFRWAGATSEEPLVLMAHYDVVPAPLEQWDRDPFSGEIVDGPDGRIIHGRGVLDDKGSLVVIAEAVEQLLAEGHTPSHDVWLSFGADEEMMGQGAREVVAHLEALGVRPWLVSDEGGAIADDILPGVVGLNAMVATVEKGANDVEILARGGGGHASTPEPNGATARLARAIVKIDENPSPIFVSQPVLEMIAALGDVLPKPLRVLTGNADKAKVVVGQLLTRMGKETGSMVRSSMAVTKLSGSPAPNVLATEARANINVRLAVGDTQAALVERLMALFDGLDIEIVSVEGNNPPPISRTDNEAWAHLKKAVAAIEAAPYDDINVVPYVQTGATDSRYFTQISDSVYRFSPLKMSRPQRDSIHAPNEWLEVLWLERGVSFHRALITGR